MERIIKVGEYKFPAKSTAASLISYKSNFGRDGLMDVFSLAKSFKSDKNGNLDVDNINMEGFNIDVFFRFLWVFAKASDKTIPPLEQWLERFEMPPFDFASEALPQVADLLGTTVKGSVQPKK